MSLVSRDRLAEACHEADPEAVADFVADLYEARGYDVDRVGDRLLCLSPGDRTVAVCPESTAPRQSVDAVVAPDVTELADLEADHIDAETLHEHIHYAIDRAKARDLLVTHLGVTETNLAADTDSRGPDSPKRDRLSKGKGVGSSDEAAGHDVGTTDDTVAPGWFDASAVLGQRIGQWGVAVLVVAVAVLLVGVAVGGLSEMPGSDRDTDDSTVVAPEPRPTPWNDSLANVAVRNATLTPTSGSDVTADAESLPPGIGPGGIADRNVLTATHRAQLTNDSHTVTIEHREYGDDGERVTGVYTETIRVENESRYRADVSVVGNLSTTPRAIAGADLFVIGNERYIDESTHSPYFRSRATPARFRWQLVRYLRWSLSVERSTIHEGSPANTTRITTDGDPYPGVENASGTVYVTDDGLISYARWTYTLPTESNKRVEFVVRTTDVGSTTVSRPPWATFDSDSNRTVDDETGPDTGQN